MKGVRFALTTLALVGCQQEPLATSTLVDHPSQLITSAANTFSVLAVDSAVTCGIQSAVAGGAGPVYCWGDNVYGETGYNAQGGAVSVPTAVAGGMSFSVLSGAGKHMCAIQSTAAGGAGTMYCWGTNQDGRTGVGSFNGITSQPTAISGGGTYSAIATDQSVTCGIRSAVAGGAGPVYCWGSNVYGETGYDAPLGSGAVAVPTAVVGGLNFSKIAGAGSHMCAIQSSTTGGAGPIYCWGTNQNGRTGVGSFNGITSHPTAVSL